MESCDSRSPLGSNSGDASQSSLIQENQNDQKIKVEKDSASPHQPHNDDTNVSGGSPQNEVISSKVEHTKDSNNDKVTPWKLVNGSNEDSADSETVTKNCDSHNSIELDIKPTADSNKPPSDSKVHKPHENTSDSVQKVKAVSDEATKCEKDIKDEQTEEHVEMEVEVSDGEQDQSLKGDSQTAADTESAPIETRRRSLRNAARRASDNVAPVENPGKSVTQSQRGRSRSPRGSPNKAELRNLKDGKGDNKSDLQTSPLELTVGTKVETSEPVVFEFEGTDEEILKEAKFPDFLRGIFDLGNFVPLKDMNNSQLNLKDGESLLDAPSLLVPLLVKKPDRLNKDTLGDVDKPAPVKKNAWETKAYFASSVGEFLIGIGLSRVREWYEKDLIKAKNRQQKREGKSEELDEEIQKHKKAWGQSRIANEPFTFDLKRCSHCDFKTESRLVLDGHYLIPHMTSRREFKCNFCTYITRDPKAILFHMVAVHGKKGRLDPSSQCFYDCPFCTFETNLKTKATSHINKCQKYFLPSRNQYPPSDWEYPAVTVKPITMNDIKSYEMCIAAASAVARSNPALAGGLGKVGRPVGRPPGVSGSPKMIRPAAPYRTMPNPQGNVSLYQQIVTTSSYKDGRLPQLSTALLQKSRFHGVGKVQSKPELTVAVPGGQIYQVVNNNGQMVPVINAGGLSSNPGSQFLLPTNSSSSGHPQPVALFSNLAGNSKNSISLIPQSGIKRGSTTMGNVRGSNYQSSTSTSVPPKLQGPYGPPNQATKAPNSTHPLLGNTTFVICEICDGYLKDLEQLRTHMLWIHKVKIHPKMLASRPPLNCQKCQWRFFTDQGLERHLLGAHGLVTSNMQELANKGQDGGRCTVCGRVYVCKLVSHMNQVHKVTLKPAHLSYKCTVCSATFNLYKLFESHVYMFHSGSVKRASSGADESSAAKKKVPPPAVVSAPVPAPPPEKKVIEINTVKPESSSIEKTKKEDEVAKVKEEEKELPPETVVLDSADTEAKETAPVGSIKKNAVFPADGIVECEWCGARVRKLHMHMRVRHTRKSHVRLCRIEKCEKCLCSFDGMIVLHTADFEDSDDATSTNADKIISIID